MTAADRHRAQSLARADIVDAAPAAAVGAGWRVRPGTWKVIAGWTSIATVLVLLLWLLAPVLLPFLAGAAAAYVLDPVVRRLIALGLGRTTASALMIATMMGHLLGAMAWLVPLAAAQIAALIQDLPDLVSDGRETLVRLLPWRLRQEVPDVGSPIGQVLADPGAALAGNGRDLLIPGLGRIAGLWSVVLFWVAMPVVAIYLPMDRPRLQRTMDDPMPRAHLPTIRRLARETDATLAGFVRGTVIVVAILVVSHSAMLSLVGLNQALVVGLVSGLVAFVPFVGAVVGGALSIGLAAWQFWDQPVWIAAVVAIFIVGQALEGEVLVPRLVGPRINLHPVWVIVAVLAFAHLMGLVGALVAVPLAAVPGVPVRFAIGRCLRSPLCRSGGPGQALVPPDPRGRQGSARVPGAARPGVVSSRPGLPAGSITPHPTRPQARPVRTRGRGAPLPMRRSGSAAPDGGGRRSRPRPRRIAPGRADTAGIGGRPARAAMPAQPGGRAGGAGAGQISPRARRLVSRARPMIRWSCTATPRTAPASTIRAVIAMSAELGSGSPEGWLCTRITAEACSSSARFSTSRG